MINKDELWFILLKISNDKKIKLLEYYRHEKNIRLNKNNIKDLIGKVDEITEVSIEKLVHYLINNEIGYITIKHKDYPKNLLDINDPPYCLFYKGNIDLLKGNLVSVIGARKCSSYGAEVAKRISKEISENNITVVSGLAAGIDSISQKNAIDYKGKTIGVLGCGIDVIYPKSNKNLYLEIINKGGLIISEYIPKTPPLAFNFPRRNRIISGISEKLIVVEASDKSGSLITVNFALESGKDIMAIPGPVINGNSSGCNKLIRDGAKPFTEIEDLYDFLNIDIKAKEKLAKNSYKELLIREINSEPKHLDDIIKSVNVDRRVLFELLFEMQNRNEIICLPGNYYAKSI